MKFTLSWLSEFVSLEGITAEELAERLTMLGLEVEDVQRLYQGLDQVLTARIVAVNDHPDADRLTVCTVEVGQETVDVVCGAPNVRQGMVTAIARPGVTMPDGTRIRKAKVRGVTSLGMLCSARELGISDDHTGIIELDGGIGSGLPLTEALELDDTLIEIDLTPNRPDCASVIGIGREVAAVTGRTLRMPALHAAFPGEEPDFSVVIEDVTLCPRYAAYRLSGVRIEPSPWWLQKRLLAVGMRPINNIVDITNYVMLETGQPLHAFDFTRLAGRGIVVRRPRDGETTFTTLDGVERTLDPDMLMICDQEQVVAVAGIMGGLDSEVTSDTTEVLLESACFDPVSIRRTARKLNLPSEASYRFERGVDPGGAVRAMRRAVDLMVELADATPLGGIDEYPGRRDPLVIPLRVDRVCDLLGMDLGSSQVAEYLRSIGFTVDGGPDLFEVTVPSFRVDIEREVDLVEEIARLVGYNDIPTTMPVITMDYPARDPLRLLRQEVAATLTAGGFCEAINYSFVSRRHHDLLGLDREDNRRQTVELLNPLTEEQAVMRTMLLPGLLENIRRNINYQQTDLRLFEIGKIFFPVAGSALPEERFQLCAVLSGGRYPGAAPIYFGSEQADFFDIKGAAQLLFRRLGIEEGKAIRFLAGGQKQQPYCDPDHAMVIMAGEREIGRLGKVAGKVLSGFSIRQDVYYLELDLELLVRMERKSGQFTPLPRYPSVKRDIALVVPDGVAAGDLLAAIREEKNELVEYADIFDVYRGKPIERGMKSVALTVTYRSAEQTLDDETVDTVHDKIVSSLMSRFGGRYREGNQ